MNLRFFFVFFSILTVCHTHAQENLKRRMLTSADYKGAPDYKDDFLARTYVSVSHQYKLVKCEIPGKVKLNMESTISVNPKSWMKFNMIRTKELLNDLLSHEQGHYDLKLIYTAELKKRLRDTCLDKLLFKSQVDAIIDSLQHKYDLLQLKYDRDTNYMWQRTMQAKWKRDINIMLKKAMSE